MQIIGRPILAAFGRDNPAAGPDLQAFQTLDAAAAWRSYGDVAAQLGTLVRPLPDGRVAVALVTAEGEEAEVILHVNHTLGLVRVERVVRLPQNLPE